MTYLQLCQRLRAECQDIGLGPTTVESTTTMDQGYIQAIREAWLEIQLLRNDWTFWPDDGSYTSSAPQILASDGDAPFIPEQYHIAIVYFALAQKALSASASELVEKHNLMWGRYNSMLVAQYTPEVVIGVSPITYYDDSCYSVGEVLAQ